MTLNEQIATAATAEVMEAWGGRLPNWDEFKQAVRDGRVQVNKTIAAEAIHWKGMPRSFMLIYGVLTVWLAYLLIPVAVAWWFIADVTAWWILGAAALAWFLYKVSRDGHCEGIKEGAVQSEDIYQVLIKRGAFLVKPSAVPQTQL